MSGQRGSSAEAPGGDTASRHIFISGVAGFLGSHLADHLVARGHHVSGCDSLVGGYRDNVSAAVDFYQYDCNLLDSMIEVTKGVDVVFHTAAAAYEGLSLFSPVFVTKNIVGSSMGVFTAAIANGVKRIVNCSSMARYGSNDVPFVEQMVPKPQDPYGIGKYAAELMLENLCRVHDVEYVNIVPHNIIGPRQRYDDPYRNVAAIMINCMLQGKQPIIYGDGEQKRCFSFVSDVVECLERAAWSDEVVGETINVGPEEPFITINQLARTIADLLDFELEPRYLAPRPQEVRLANCSSAKARRLLGFEPQYTLEQGLQEMISYIERRGPRPFEYHVDLELRSELAPRSWRDKLL